MRKTWIVAAGLVSGAVFRDFCFGSIFGVLFGFLIGIPVYLVLAFFLKLVLKSGKSADATAGGLTIGLTVISFWMVFHPPAPILFRMVVTRPIPPSVTNLKGSSFVIGPDGSRFMKFNIDQPDLNSILEEKQLTHTPINIMPSERGTQVEVISQGKSFSFALEKRLPWYRLNSANGIEFYVSDKRSEKESCLEYILYDPNTKEALYERAYY